MGQNGADHPEAPENEKGREPLILLDSRLASSSAGIKRVQEVGSRNALSSHIGSPYGAYTGQAYAILPLPASYYLYSHDAHYIR